VYGVVWDERADAGDLTRLDPRTLLPRRGAPRLAVRDLMSWTVSPDRSTAVFVDSDPNGLAAGNSTLHLIDLVHMRQTAAIGVSAPVGRPNSALWLGGGRVLLLGEVENYVSSERNGVISLAKRPVLTTTILDVRAARVVAQHRYAGDGQSVAVDATRHGLVVLMAPAEQIGAATIGLVDPNGRFRDVRLGKVTAGFERPHGSGVDSVRNREVTPGLAVDEETGRVYVLAAGSAVAEVTLPDLRVAYHPVHAPGRPPALLAWLRSAAFAASAEAKMQSGTVRNALWLGDGRLAVWGSDSDYRGEDDSATGQTRPSGLQVVDTRDWSVRTLDPGVSEVARAGNRLVTAGTVRRTAEQSDSTTGDGVRIRTPGAGPPVHLYAGRPIQWVQVYGDYAYVELTGSGQEPGYAVIDTRVGTVVGEHKGLLIPDVIGG
jgi:hypothetical protein